MTQANVADSSLDRCYPGDSTINHMKGITL